MRIIKETIIKNYKLLLQKGMNLGSEGNISVKFKEKVFITPSGVDIKNLKIENISIVDFEGNLNNRVKPSSELDLHLLIYKKRKEINSIVHCHSDWASILSCFSFAEVNHYRCLEISEENHHENRPESCSYTLLETSGNGVESL